MLGLIVGLIRLYFGLGILCGLVLFTAIIYRGYVADPPVADVTDVIVDALVQGLFRIFLWLPTLWNDVLNGGRPFLDWLLGV